MRAAREGRPRTAPAPAARVVVSRAGEQGDGAGVDTCEQLLGRRVLKQIAARPRVEGAQHVRLGVIGGEHHHLRRGGETTKRCCDLHTAGPAFAKVEINQDDVGTFRSHDGGRRVEPVHGGHHLEVVLRVGQRAEPCAHHGMVVHQHEADHGATRRDTIGRCTEMVVPSPGTLSTYAAPPRETARSRMPANPRLPALPRAPTPAAPWRARARGRRGRQASSARARPTPRPPSRGPPPPRANGHWPWRWPRGWRSVAGAGRRRRRSSTHRLGRRRRGSRAGPI